MTSDPPSPAELSEDSSPADSIGRIVPDPLMDSLKLRRVDFAEGTNFNPSSEPLTKAGKST